MTADRLGTIENTLRHVHAEGRMGRTPDFASIAAEVAALAPAAGGADTRKLRSAVFRGLAKLVQLGEPGDVARRFKARQQWPEELVQRREVLDIVNKLRAELDTTAAPAPPPASDLIRELQAIDNTRQAIGGTPEVAALYRDRCATFLHRNHGALLAALAATPAAGFRWDLLPSYLIDHCEGDTISEEGLQAACAAMLRDPKYCAAPAGEDWDGFCPDHGTHWVPGCAACDGDLSNMPGPDDAAAPTPEGRGPCQLCWGERWMKDGTPCPSCNRHGSPGPEPVVPAHRAAAQADDADEDHLLFVEYCADMLRKAGKPLVCRSLKVTASHLRARLAQQEGGR